MFYGLIVWGNVEVTKCDCMRKSETIAYILAYFKFTGISQLIYVFLSLWLAAHDVISEFSIKLYLILNGSNLVANYVL